MPDEEAQTSDSESNNLQYNPDPASADQAHSGEEAYGSGDESYELARDGILPDCCMNHPNVSASFQCHLCHADICETCDFPSLTAPICAKIV